MIAGKRKYWLYHANMASTIPDDVLTRAAGTDIHARFRMNCNNLVNSLIFHVAPSSVQNLDVTYTYVSDQIPAKKTSPSTSALLGM